LLRNEFIETKEVTHMRNATKRFLGVAAVVALTGLAMASVAGAANTRLTVKDSGSNVVFSVQDDGSFSGSKFVYDGTAKRLGTGLSSGHSAESSFHAVDITNSANRGVIVGQHDSSASAANVQFRKSRGDDINNAAYVAGVGGYVIVNYKDYIGSFHGFGWDGTQWINGASIAFQVDTATPAVNKVGMSMNFMTGETQNGGTGNIQKVSRLYISSKGIVGVGGGFTADAPPTVSGTGVMDIKGDVIRLEGTRTPTQGSTCNAGEIAWDANYVYVCTAANTWKRASLGTY
jgi:hypothetical protein